MSNFSKFTFSIIISPVGYPSSAVGFPSSPLGPGWISFQWRDFLLIWRKILLNPRHRIGLIKYHVKQRGREGREKKEEKLWFWSWLLVELALLQCASWNTNNSVSWELLTNYFSYGTNVVAPPCDQYLQTFVPLTLKMVPNPKVICNMFQSLNFFFFFSFPFNMENINLHLNQERIDDMINIKVFHK